MFSPSTPTHAPSDVCSVDEVRELGWAVLEEHGGPKLDIMKEKLACDRADSAVLRDPVNKAPRSKGMNWFLEQFNKYGYRDDWFASMVAVLDRAASKIWHANARGTHRRSGSDSPYLEEPFWLAAALIVLKMSEAEAEVDAHIRDIVFRIAISPRSPKLWHDIRSAEFRICRALDYRLFLPTPRDLTVRLAMELLVVNREAEEEAPLANERGGGVWPGFDEDQLPPPQPYRLESDSPGGNPTPMARFALLACFLVELVVVHEPAWVYRPSSMSLPLAALCLALQAFGHTPPPPSHCLQAFRRFVTDLPMAEVLELRLLRDDLCGLWARLGRRGDSKVVKKWKDRVFVCLSDPLPDAADVENLPPFLQALLAEADVPFSPLPAEEEEEEEAVESLQVPPVPEKADEEAAQARAEKAAVPTSETTPPRSQESASGRIPSVTPPPVVLPPVVLPPIAQSAVADARAFLRPIAPLPSGVATTIPGVEPCLPPVRAPNRPIATAARASACSQQRQPVVTEASAAAQATVARATEGDAAAETTSRTAKDKPERATSVAPLAKRQRTEQELEKDTLIIEIEDEDGESEITVDDDDDDEDYEAERKPASGKSKGASKAAAKPKAKPKGRPKGQVKAAAKPKAKLKAKPKEKPKAKAKAQSQPEPKRRKEEAGQQREWEDVPEGHEAHTALQMKKVKGNPAYVQIVPKKRFKDASGAEMPFQVTIQRAGSVEHAWRIARLCYRALQRDVSLRDSDAIAEYRSKLYEKAAPTWPK